MLYPLIGVRLHGWLDDIVTAVYLAGAFIFGLSGAALAVALAGATVHFVLTRITNYPQGTFKFLDFRTHAFIELGEGLAVLIAVFLLSHAGLGARAFLTFMGASQVTAFLFSDYRWPRAS